MAHNLVIVESPAKAQTIAKYLGSDYQVLASMGHVRDLPASKLGVDTESNFAPQYVIPPRARQTIKKLKEAVKGKKAVYLATDLDREGEAIAWHIAEVLELASKEGLTVKRITFDEITKDAITKAISQPRDIYMDLVDAQQARRVLDRLVGYTLSPVLWKKLYRGLSAGRVQSVALRLVVEREAERNAFVPLSYHNMRAQLLSTAKAPFTATISEISGVKVEDKSLTDRASLESLVSTLESARWSVLEVQEKEVNRRPSAPYTTSSFQQDAVNKLGLSAKRAMRIAQSLYEAGHITYMRTDSVEIAKEAIAAIRGFVSSEYGARYLPASAPQYKSKASRAQEAHEAIRPTNPSTHPESVSSDSAAVRVYSLIRSRALASQMAPAVFMQRTARIEAAHTVFKANGQEMLFPGFLAAWGGSTDEEVETLPTLTKGEATELESLEITDHQTEPPPRYTEASLIKALEEHGIGRPSTYAPTIDTLAERLYITIDQRRIAPEKVGVAVTELLTTHFSDIVDVGFTATMEDSLDKIAEGGTSYSALLADFWQPFQKQVQEKTESIPRINMVEETEEVCPNCGAPMVIKPGRFGRFLACSKFPECKTTAPLQKKQDSGLLCPIDGKPLVERRGKRGIFYGCSRYPNCTFAVWKREQLPVKIAELEAAGTELPFKDRAMEAFTALPQPENTEPKKPRTSKRKRS